MTGNYADGWQQQSPFPHPAAPTGYPPPRPRKPLWPWIIGAIVAVTVLLVAVIGFAVTRLIRHPVGTKTVTYEVTGPGKGEVEYNDAQGNVTILPNVDLPWRIQLMLPADVMPLVSVEQPTAGPLLTCRITSGDTIIDEKKKAIGFVFCSDDPDKY